MSGDPRVLAPLQQAYLKLTSHPKDIGDMALLQLQWEDHYGVIAYRPFADADAEIRAWTPPPAEPSLEQRVATIERSIKTMNDSVQSLDREHLQLDERIAALEQHPEPTAPDDPVCANEPMTAMDDPMRNETCVTCGHLRGEHMGLDGSGPCDLDWFGGPDPCKCRKFAPAPQPAPDLDPVRVEAAAKAAWEDGGRMTSWDEASADIHELWIRDAGLMITTYLKGGGA